MNLNPFGARVYCTDPDRLTPSGVGYIVGISRENAEVVYPGMENVTYVVAWEYLEPVVTPEMVAAGKLVCKNRLVSVPMEEIYLAMERART